MYVNEEHTSNNGTADYDCLITTYCDIIITIIEKWATSVTRTATA